MTVDDHERSAASETAARPIQIGILTVSDSRTRDRDGSGDRIESIASAAGWRIPRRELVTDDPEPLAAMLRSLLDTPEIEVVLVTGGTGVSPRDRTVDLVDALSSRSIPGYGERLRAVSFERIGHAGLLSRATAGLVDRPDGGSSVAIFTMPGSPNGVETAMREIIVPMLDHLIWLLRDPAD